MSRVIKVLTVVASVLTIATVLLALNDRRRRSRLSAESVVERTSEPSGSVPLSISVLRSEVASEKVVSPKVDFGMFQGFVDNAFSTSVRLNASGSKVSKIQRSKRGLISSLIKGIRNQYKGFSKSLPTFNKDGSLIIENNKRIADARTLSIRASKRVGELLA